MSVVFSKPSARRLNSHRITGQAALDRIKRFNGGVKMPLQRTLLNMPGEFSYSMFSVEFPWASECASLLCSISRSDSQRTISAGELDPISGLGIGSPQSLHLAEVGN